MDNKSWLWRKKSSEKTIVTKNKFGFSAKGIDEEKHLKGNEVGPISPMKNLNERLASVLFEYPAKDGPATKHEKLPPETILGDSTVKNAPSTDREITETDIVHLKKELDEAQSEGLAANERLARADAALKQSMQQLSTFHEEQEQKICEAVMKATCGFETTRKRLEEKLIDMTKKVADLAIENTNLSKALLLKEKLVEELHKHMSQTDAELDVLIARLDSTEKENTFLKYEFHMLEKEFEVRGEELEYNRRSVEASHRQYLECVTKVTKLEAECQRLRVLMRKRLPGPASLAKMKNEVDVLRRPNPARDLILRDAAMEESLQVPFSHVSLLIEQLHGVEEENRTLKETIMKKQAELKYSRIMFSQTASRLSEVEAQLIELSAGKKSMDLAISTGSDDRVSTSESWSSTLISELEHFRDGKVKSTSERKTFGVSDMSLMDDFVEMEKLAIVSLQSPECGNCPVSASKELVAVKLDRSSYGGKKLENHSEDVATDKSFDWLQVVLKAIFKQQHISKRSVTELLEDVKIALGFINHPNACEADTSVSAPAAESGISGNIAWKSPSTSSMVSETAIQCDQSNLSKSVYKTIQLIEGINVTTMVSNDASGSKRDQGSSPSATPKDYFVRVFQWRSSELNDVLKRFVHTCHSLLSRKVGLESFAEELSFTLDWILSNHVTPKDASSARDKIKRHFGWNKSQSETEVEVTVGVSSQTEDIDCNLQEENKRLNEELKSLEVKLQLMSENLTLKLQESERSLERLQAEVEILKESKGIIEDQLENQKSTNEDLDTQVQVAKAKLNEVMQQLSSLEVEFEDKCNCCEDLEATCLELQLQLESVAKKENHNYGSHEDGTQPQTGWEITATSVKLAECKETAIRNLEKQHKAVDSSREVAIFSKVLTATNATTIATNNKITRRHFSLQDQMKAEDNAKAIILRSPIEDAPRSSSLDHSNNALVLSSCRDIVCAEARHPSSPNKPGNNAVAALAIMPSKRQGGVGLLRRLLMRKKKGSIKKSRSLVRV